MTNHSKRVKRLFALEDNEQKMGFVRGIIQEIGEDPNREGLIDTPSRVVKSWTELYKGYAMEPEAILKIFDEPEDEMVILRDVEFYSMCEHHMLPFFGRAHIGYLPMENRVVGVSKLARLLDCFARRLQIQERMGRSIVEALIEHLNPAGCGVVLEAQHFCICGRGVGKQNSVMVTSSMRGSFREDASVRAEFLGLIGKR